MRQKTAKPDASTASPILTGNQKAKELAASWQAMGPPKHNVVVRRFEGSTLPTEDVKDQMGHSCGTIACLAGWTDIMENGVEIVGSEGGAMLRAMEILGLPYGTAHRLFHGGGLGATSLTRVTPQQAIAVVRNLAETGSVEWNRFDRNGKDLNTRA